VVRAGLAVQKSGKLCGEAVNLAAEGRNDRLTPAGVFLLPMLVDGVREFGEPGAILRQFQHVRGGKILHAVLRRISEWPQQLRLHQRRDVVRLAVKHPPCLFRRQAGGQVAEQAQEPMLILFHTPSVVASVQKRTEIRVIQEPFFPPDIRFFLPRRKGPLSPGQGAPKGSFDLIFMAPFP
jgi:hypothetical protein